MEVDCYVIFICNTLWFAAAFYCFSLVPFTTIKKLIPLKGDQNTPAIQTLATAIRFLGGMNLAFSVLSGLAILSVFQLTGDQLGLLAFVFSIAHGSQFAFNVPMALQEQQGKTKPIWPVIHSSMLYIFIIDGSLMVANIALSYSLLCHHIVH